MSAVPDPPRARALPRPQEQRTRRSRFAGFWRETLFIPAGAKTIQPEYGTPDPDGESAVILCSRSAASIVLMGILSCFSVVGGDSIRLSMPE